MLARTIKQTASKALKTNTVLYRRTFLTSRIIFDSKQYTDSDEWLYRTIESTKVGLTENAIEQLGDLVYIEYQVGKGDVVEEGDEIVSIESVKATDEIKAPFDCVILEINNEVEDSIETFLDKINQSPENTDDSWLFKIDKTT
tara:strand:- start:795 stop:1223 length:429 start_codon:yes stop_codon:yes gene_type:complete